MLEIKTICKTNFSSSNYHILLLEDEESFLVDFVEYKNSKCSILFISPYQNIEWLNKNDTKIKQISFHADFYCIEYHKKEVACNGVLFNNIYLKPFVSLKKQIYQEIETIIDKMNREMLSDNPFSESIIKTYLQLILALCSREKTAQLDEVELNTLPNKLTVDFQKLVEAHFCTEKSPAFYADKLAISTNALSKKIKKEFGKTPTKIIQERVILEAKKQLHLTHNSIKEIAFGLNFDDEFYFSRYFKKVVGKSPRNYREDVGISIVAKEGSPL